MKHMLLLFLIIYFTVPAAFSQDWKEFPYKPAGGKIAFPLDEGRHASEPIEWWYISGHLTGKTSGKTYSFMLTYFYYPASTFDGFRILNLLDDATGEFYEDTRPLHYTQLSTTQLDIYASIYAGGNESWTNLKNNENEVIPYQYSIKALSSRVTFDLNVSATKRPLILDDDGYLEQGQSSYTYYYSLTRNEVEGSLTLNGMTEEVKGTSWIDRQYGNFNPLTGEKYEWFHIQLSNGMDMNLWNIFTPENTIPNSKKYRILSAWVDNNTQYTTSDFVIERLGYNYMPDSVMCYSSKWRLTSPRNKLDLTISIKNDQTEVIWPFRFYEGATEITGTVNGTSVTGFGFTELLHNYEKPEIIFKEPGKEKYDISIPISWQLLNPDDGRPVKYDLAFSLDGKNYVPVVEGISDTFYLWTSPPLKNGDDAWLRVTANSIDNKLTGITVSDHSWKIVANHGGSNNTQLFPNPATDYIMLKPAFKSDNPDARIISAKGNLVRKIKKNSLSDSIEIGNLPPGVYYLQFDFAGSKKALMFIKK